MKIKVGVFCFLIVNLTLVGQINTAETGAWGMLFNQTRLHNKWSLHSEVQFRSYEINPITEQLLIEAALIFIIIQP